MARVQPSDGCDRQHQTRGYLRLVRDVLHLDQRYVGEASQRRLPAPSIGLHPLDHRDLRDPCDPAFRGRLAALEDPLPRTACLARRARCDRQHDLFAAIAVMPLADATALFFVAPLFITLLSVLVLGETVGPRRIAAICVGFLGVVVMMRPGVDLPSRWILTLPLIAAACYAGMQVLTRKLGGKSSAAAMAIYIQVTFILVSTGFFVTAGDGSFAEGSTDQSLIFLLRAWTLPPVADWWLFGLMGLAAGGIGYALSQAYRIANASVIAPFEYFNLPMAIFWGWMVFGELPDVWVAMGIALIALSGIYVFLRERVKAGQAP
jgi:drug/metabolite transporter (DMT)-like permease